MRISVSDAKGRLTELVRRSEAGEEVVLTRHGQAVARLTPVRNPVDAKARRRLAEALRVRVADKLVPGPDAARSQGFLYDEEGLPR